MGFAKPGCSCSFLLTVPGHAVGCAYSVSIRFLEAIFGFEVPNRNIVELTVLCAVMSWLSVKRDSVQLKESGMVHFFAGFVSGIMPMFVLHPLDLCKVRQQMSSVVGRPGVFTTMSLILRLEGFRALYKGILPNVTSYCLMNSLHWGIYGNCKEKVLDSCFPLSDHETVQPAFDLLVSRSLASCFTALALPIIQCPFEHVKCVQQAHLGENKSTISVARHMLKTSPSILAGVQSLYRGFHAQLLREVVGCFFLVPLR